jgi:hypothetical protein
MLYLSVAFVKVVQVYENYYVTHLLNPLPREEDLQSLRSNTLSYIVFQMLYLSVVFSLS